MKAYDLVIIGAGASGLMAAGRYRSLRIALLEANAEIAQKIKISGGGRCNITNQSLSLQHYQPQSDFVKEVLKGFDQHALLNYLKKRGLIPILRKKNQYFCQKSSQELVDLLKKEIQGVEIFTSHKVESLQKEERGFLIRTQKRDFLSQKVVVASGGLSFPKLGASGIAFEIAKSFGHTITPLKPALVGLTLQKEQFWMKALSGISLEVEVRVGQKRIFGDLLFAHRGISGPAILNASLYWERGEIVVDFLPNRVLDTRFFQSSKHLSTLFGLPKRFGKAFLEAIGVEDKAAKRLNEKERAKIAQIKSYVFAPAGNFGFSKAEVTKGGIALDEIDPSCMESRKCQGLFFLGESLDVAGELGGYNFQWAFASAQRLRL